MRKLVNIILAALVFAAGVSCTQGRGVRHSEADGEVGHDGSTSSSGIYRSFPKVQVPAICSDVEGAAQYLAVHYWDAFFNGSGANDTSSTLGVRNVELEKAFADYVGMLDYISLRDAQDGILSVFGKVSDIQRGDSLSHIYTVFAQMAEKYLYDPNSPLRNEDYFLPYVSAMAISDLTSEDLRPSYEYQKMMCNMNRAGTVAPDFNFRTDGGRTMTLHSVKALYTVLFFSNPGCTACKEIIDALGAIPDAQSLVAQGKLAIINIYIDEELDKWREYLPNYPSYWICGYDYMRIIRKDTIYNVRAIPSLYLLDEQKRVICKDAPTEKLINKLIDKLCQ